MENNKELREEIEGRGEFDGEEGGLKKNRSKNAQRRKQGIIVFKYDRRRKKMKKEGKGEGRGRGRGGEGEEEEAHEACHDCSSLSSTAMAVMGA